MEVIELQHPDAIVFEVLYCTYDFRTVSPGRSHTFFDGMPMCRAKREAIEDLIEKDQRIYYYLNLGLYHNRWKNLTEEDFQSVLISPRGNYFTDSIVPIRSIPVVAPEEKEEIPEEMFRYLEMMVELCRQNNVKLIWYVAPYNSIETSYTDLFQEQRMFNWIGDYAAEQGIPFYNLFYEMDQIGLEFDKDFRDSQHLNCYGQEKLTHYMAEMRYFDY